MVYVAPFLPIAKYKKGLTAQLLRTEFKGMVPDLAGRNKGLCL